MGGKPQILVVDDDKLIINTFKDLLDAEGYDVLTAFDGQEGLAKARAAHPNLIILDVMMPKLDGFKVAKLLKFDRNFQQIPIIILTAKAGEEDFALSRASGADAYMTKPIDPPLLLEKIRSLLQTIEDRSG